VQEARTAVALAAELREEARRLIEEVHRCRGRLSREAAAAARAAADLGQPGRGRHDGAGPRAGRPRSRLGKPDR
jgi:hypothetical protein